MDRKFEIFKVQSAAGAEDGNSERKKNMLSITNLTKRWSKDNVVFDGYCMNFEEGIYLIVGESGCGKTTLIRCIAGLDTQYEGEIRLNGVLRKRCDMDVHMVHQHYFSYPWLNELQNVLMVHKGHKKRITKELAAEAAYMLEKTQIDTQEYLTPQELSGGQDQRLSICSALVNHESKVFVYDEPTSALDIKNTNLVAQLIREHQEKDNTIEIIITHDSELLKAFSITVNTAAEAEEEEKCLLPISL